MPTHFVRSAAHSYRTDRSTFAAAAVVVVGVVVATAAAAVAEQRLRMDSLSSAVPNAECDCSSGSVGWAAALAVATVTPVLRTTVCGIPRWIGGVGGDCCCSTDGDAAGLMAVAVVAVSVADAAPFAAGLAAVAASTWAAALHCTPELPSVATPD